MGKKRSNISGLSYFIAEAFSSTSELAAPTDIKPYTIGDPDSAKVAASTVTTQRSSKRTDDTTLGDVRPNKKRKVGLLGPGWEKYDATELVPFYTQASQAPVHLQKYFSQRERYFSLYSSGTLLDEEGWYSVTPERVADQIAERCRCDVVLDAFCGVGGNAIAFARTCERVIALDTSPVRLALARHNAALYGVADRIEFVLADFLSFARMLRQLQDSHQRREESQRPNQDLVDSLQSRQSRKIDVVFLSPPWGGPSYLTDAPDIQNDRQNNALENADVQFPPEYSLASIRPVHGKELFQLARGLTRNVAYYLPRNVKLEEVAALVGNQEGEKGQDSGKKGKKKGKQVKEVEMVEVEEEWMGSKLKALTCYFGGLVAGQEDQF